MARPELHGRQYTIYASRKEDLIKWKELCPPTMTLNAWILEAIERFVEETDSDPILHPSPRRGGADINAFRRENAALKAEIERLTARLSDFEKRRPLLPLNPKLKGFLEKGGTVKSAGSVDYWTIVDKFSGDETYIDHEPTEDDIIKFKDGFGYTKVKIVENDTANKTLIIRPSDRAGGMDISEIKLRHAQGISRTLNELENLGLIEFKGGGWKWIK
jgi:hypothetical protein